MSKNTNNRSSEKTASTHIDLGDDLIEKTAMLVEPSMPPPDQTEDGSRLPPVATPGEAEESVESRLHSAQILAGEGLLEQAKHVLHRILVQDSTCIPARKALEDIHDLELKQIFGDESGRRVFGEKTSSENIQPEDVLEQLDRDLSLGLRDVPALLRDAESLRALCLRLESELADVSAQDRVDIGIGFLEMGLGEVAATQFQAALQLHSKEHPEPLVRFLVSTTSLVALAWMTALKPLEAEFVILPLLNNSEIPPELKVELFYLMGRVQDQLGKSDLAVGWFRQVLEINPKYRDVRERLAKIR